MSLPLTSLFLLAITLLTTCSKPTVTPQPAFYHWQTELDIDSTEIGYLQALGTRRLYVKFFDVDWAEATRQAVPKAALISTTDLAGYDIVPTVFITNRTMREITPSSGAELASRILTKIEELRPGLQPSEIQLDCDWTLRTQVAYFDFLTTMKRQMAERFATRQDGVVPQLSVTLRLHQYRYPEETGVPPVDRAMLMFYNMGELTDWEEPNSILNPERARPYLSAPKSYPLALDVALPLFRWAVLFRNGKMIKLLPEIDAAAILSAGGRSLDGTQNTRFEIPESTYLEGYYLYAGDRIRLEAVSPAGLRAAAEMLRGVASGPQPYVSFYHLDRELLRAFGPDELRRVMHILNPDRE